MNEVIILVLENKLGITNQIALAKAEERISKQKAKHLYDSGKINEIEQRFIFICFQIFINLQEKFEQ